MNVLQEVVLTASKEEEHETILKGEEKKQQGTQKHS